MPEMDGYIATEHIRQWQTQQQHPATPIIAMTANAMKGDRERCIRCGMNDYVSKPITIDFEGVQLVCREFLRKTLINNIKIKG